MITQEQIEEKNFKYYTTSSASASNPIERDDYIAAGLVGKAEYLILLQHYPSTNQIKIRDFWNDPIIAPEHYFIGEVTTQQELDTALASTRFEQIKEIDFDDIWLYR